ncbi:hypothetical protein [Polaromonas sp. JS666]|uniref:hypothetical protein n=1 Tax=Polaromonas sp. (strain JS666 / ATCC BAA-500) TaxID=296591 RepID=UPI0000464791|nr:hypothetical protein [Polaromonas sp. JS666]ABE43581.1 hypothetical protein Bpro_1645 [Polaromonas sp. JS666]
MSADFTKSERRQLRELAAEVYEAEAHALLEELDEDFARWRKDEIRSSDLLMSIHDFHQHQSRELWSMYQGLSDDMAVERGLRLGLIAEERLSPKVLFKLRSKG